MQTHQSICAFFHRIKPAGRWIRVIFLTVLLSSVSSLSLAGAENGQEIIAGQVVTEVSAAEAHGESLSANAPVIFNVGGLPITNSMIAGWLVASILVAVSVRFRYLVRAGRSTKFTATIEALVIFLHDFLAGVIGERLAQKTFWLLGSFFIFILSCNWLGLLPGIGSVGWGYSTEHAFEITQPLFRGVNADLNTTLALGALFFLFWFIWAWKENGPVGILKHIFAPQGDSKGIMYVVMVVVFLAVGLLEVLSIIIRPFSLAIRLYGNVFAGEVLLETMLHKIPMLAWLLPVPFYLMEVLVGLIQALVFTLLSAVFVMLICSHQDGEHPEHKTEPDSQQHE